MSMVGPIATANLRQSYRHRLRERDAVSGHGISAGNMLLAHVMWAAIKRVHRRRIRRVRDRRNAFCSVAGLVETDDVIYDEDLPDLLAWCQASGTDLRIVA